jgi:hypothetical protein
MVNVIVIGMVLSSLLLLGCIPPPVRTSFAGAPGRRQAGDGEISIAPTVAFPLAEEVDVFGELGGAYAFNDRLSVEAGPVGGSPALGGFAGGYAGLRLTFPPGPQAREGWFWDLELGGGGGRIVMEEIGYGGGYTGVGVAYRWPIVALYGRLRFQAIGLSGEGFYSWDSVAVGNEFRLGERVDLYWAASESLFTFELEDPLHAPAFELGLAVRI